jgi:hypothetical protein
MKIISFCLYGNLKKYCKGLYENLKIIQDKLSDYNSFLYISSDVDEEWINKYKAFSFVKVFITNFTGHDNMISRFFAIDEEDVDIAIIRDADSRLHDRDIWCIRDFEKSSYMFHTIRDHPSHRAFILGGLWGIKKGCLPNKITIKSLYNKINPRNEVVNKIQFDQIFLKKIVYPIIHSKMIVYTFSEKMKMNDFENIKIIPLQIINNNFCGLSIYYDENEEEVKEYIWNYYDY